MDTIGFVGVGTMGGPMAEHLLNDGNDVVVYDTVDDATTRLADRGARVASGPRDLASRCDVVFLSLPWPDDVESVVLDSLAPELSAGSVVVDMSTSLPSVTRDLAEVLSEAGISMLGAPVSRGKGAAEEGTLAVLVGGDETVIDRCRPLFDAFATDLIHVGPSPEHGHAVKLLNNYLSFSALLATCEAAALGEQVGLELEPMMDAFNQSSGRNSATMRKFPDHVATGTYDSGAPIGLVTKDLGLFTEFGDEADVPLLLGEVVTQLVSYAAVEYGEEVDQTHIYDFFRERLGVDER